MMNSKNDKDTQKAKKMQENKEKLLKESMEICKFFGFSKGNMPSINNGGIVGYEDPCEFYFDGNSTLNTLRYFFFLFFD